MSDLRSWQRDTETFWSSKPELMTALKDPARVFNMDETSVEVNLNYGSFVYSLIFFLVGQFWTQSPS